MGVEAEAGAVVVPVTVCDHREVVFGTADVFKFGFGHMGTGLRVNITDYLHILDFVYAAGGVVKHRVAPAVEGAVFFCLFLNPSFKEQGIVGEPVGVLRVKVACFVRVDIGVGDGLAQHCVFVVRSEVEEGNLLKPPRFFGGCPRIYPNFGAVFGLEELDARVVLGEDELECFFGHLSFFDVNLTSVTLKW